MATLTRLTDSCLHLRTDDEAFLFDPGFHTYQGGFDLGSTGEVSRVLITHEHRDHVHPDFVKWLVDRGDEVRVHSNAAVAAILERNGIEVSLDPPPGVGYEDVLHAKVPSGDQPPNRSFTVEGVLTHPGDSQEPTVSAPVLALPLITPWGSVTSAVAFARRLQPAHVVAIHDFYLSDGGRAFVRDMARNVLAADGIELLDLDWGESAEI